MRRRDLAFQFGTPAPEVEENRLATIHLGLSSYRPVTKMPKLSRCILNNAQQEQDIEHYR